MNTKISTNQVIEAARAIALPNTQIEKLLAMLADMKEPDDEEKAPPVKKQFVILVSDPAGVMPKTDLVGWVLQIPESESVATTEERIFRTAYDYNCTKKGRLLPVQTVGEAVEGIKGGAFKENDIWVKTKTPVLILRTANEIPKTDGVLKDDNRGVYKDTPDLAVARFVHGTMRQCRNGEMDSVTITTPGKQGGVKIDRAGVHALAPEPPTASAA